MYILVAERFVDVVERDSAVLVSIAELRKPRRLSLAKLIIDPLSAGWDTPRETHHFRTGCGPLEALATAKELLASEYDWALIEGIEPLHSAYAHERDA
jgi:hypothetical protein